jgi:hypothetical protein
MRVERGTEHLQKGRLDRRVSEFTPVLAQARPLPGPDVQQIYDRLLPQIEKIAAFDHYRGTSL